MYDVYSKMLDGNDVRRISKIEWFDEFEEWHLIQAHYCLLVAAQGSFDHWFSELTKNASFSVSFVIRVLSVVVTRRIDNDHNKQNYSCPQFTITTSTSGLSL